MITKIVHNLYIRNSLVLFLGTAVGSVFNYFFQLLVGRYASVETYGQAQSLVSLLNIVSVPAMTLTMVAANLAAKKKAESDFHGSGNVFYFLSKKVIFYGLPVLMILFLASPYIGNFLNIHDNLALAIIWLLMFLSFLSSVSSGILSGWQRFRALSEVGVVGAAVKFFSAVIIIFIGITLDRIIGSLLLGLLTAYVISLFSLRFILSGKNVSSVRESRSDFQSIGKFLFPVFFANLAIALFGNADMVLATKNLDGISAGQYGALTIVSKIIFFLTGILASVLFSMSSEKNHQGEPSGKILVLSLLLTLSISALASIIYLFFPGLVLSFFFGEKYHEVSGLLFLFSILAGMFSVANIMFQYLLSVRKTAFSYLLFLISAAMAATIIIFGNSIKSIAVISICFQVTAVAVATFPLRRELLLGIKTYQKA